MTRKEKRIDLMMGSSVLTKKKKKLKKQPKRNKRKYNSRNKDVETSNVSPQIPSSSTPMSLSSSTSSDVSISCQQARQLWLTATSDSELEQVEMIYRKALNAKIEVIQSNDVNTKKKKKTNNPPSMSYAALSPTEYRQAGEKLSLLYIQSGRSQKAMKGLQYLGFTCRLADAVLNYPLEPKKTLKPLSSKSSTITPPPPCCILDDFLSNQEFHHLQSVFVDANAYYWTNHNYQVEPPSPYFSYIIPLNDDLNCNYGLIGRIIHKIQNCDVIQTQFSNLRNSKYVELWAHNRPHSSGHQLHFDSDNEGHDGIVKNPILSTILYLSSSSEGGVGGPTLITNQTLSTTSLVDTKGWLAYSKAKRLVAFDGKVLHGVIPGKGICKVETDNEDSIPRRRVTLMLAFWKDIQIRPSANKPGGAARPWPMTTSTTSSSTTTITTTSSTPTWAKQLTKPVSDNTNNNEKYKVVEPMELDHIYEHLNGQPYNPKKYGLHEEEQEMPEYEHVFQGF